MVARNASGWLKSGVMSLNRMPGLGKSGMSRMNSRRSIVAGPGIDHLLP